MKAIFLGAGCSYGTLCGHDACPPLAKDFGSCLARRAPEFETRFPELVKVAHHLRTTLPKIGLEELWTCIDYYAKFSPPRGSLLDSPPWNWVVAATELKTGALLELYGSRLDEVAEALPKSTNYTLGKLLVEQVKAGDVLISFNYDTIVERLARNSGVRLTHGAGAEETSAVRFAKPHGSTSWKLNSPPQLTDEPFLHSLPCKNEPPLMLGAVPIKSELILEVQFCYGACDVFHVVMSQWEAVVDAVRDAEKLVILGYSFPREDLYGRFLFKEGMRQRDGRKITIEYYDVNEKVGESILETFLMKDIKIDLCWKGRVTAAWPK